MELDHVREIGPDEPQTCQRGSGKPKTKEKLDEIFYDEGERTYSADAVLDPGSLGAEQQ
jgi:hypothetical protein